jgi:hypothetical protein
VSADHRWLADIEGVLAKLPKPFAIDDLVALADKYT